MLIFSIANLKGCRNLKSVSRMQTWNWKAPRIGHLQEEDSIVHSGRTFGKECKSVLTKNLARMVRV
ncbi:hypothetical protein VMF7928_01171 [Vibrio marisflavi CECT 7928]|uniref:Uncharacterized protein n=1 Tax=Vibrio marisflavi CECT 7928 TaxID=634439 RepID=A0ABN8E2S2_9VIBR|nr:hypothetical protein VMF7928_01171 [Vibrio marisflavi CECT 7928]